MINNAHMGMVRVMDPFKFIFKFRVWLNFMLPLIVYSYIQVCVLDTVGVTLYMYQVAYSIKKTDFYRVFLKTK